MPKVVENNDELVFVLKNALKLILRKILQDCMTNKNSYFTYISFSVNKALFVYCK